MANGFGQGLQQGGNVLQAIGADLQGRTSEFQRGQREERVLRQQEDEKRQQALFQDAAVLQDHILRGNLDAAKQLISQRQGLLQQMGATDTSDTDAISVLSNQGDWEGVLKMVTPTVRAGQIRGILDETPSSKFIGMSKDEKQAFFQTPSGVEAMDIKGATGTAPDLTALQKNVQAATGAEIGSPEFQQAMLEQLGKEGTVFNIGGEQRTPEEEIRIATEIKRSEKLAEHRSKGIAGRESEAITNGQMAAELIPNLKRSLVLLETIETGGIDKALLDAKGLLGIESANEAELRNALDQAVLKQIKPIFGAQVTAAEGRWLKDIEAGFGKSTPGNIRLIKRGLQLSEDRAKRGIRAAKSAGDSLALEEIQGLIKFDITPEDFESGRKAVVEVDF